MKTTLRLLNLAIRRPEWTLAVVLAVFTAVVIWRGGPGGPPSSLANGSANAPPAQAETGESASAPTPSHGGLAVPGENLLRTAIEQITYGPAISAHLHQRVRHSGGELLGVGGYWQEPFARGGRFNLELRTKMSHLRIVGDGAFIWRQAAIGEDYRITRIDLQQLARLRGVQGVPTPTPVGARLPDQQSVSPLSLGGLGHLLESLSEIYTFGDTQASTISNVRMFELHGVIDAESAAKLGKASNAGTTSLLPPQLPSVVTVSLGQDDLFPYRFVYEWKPAGGEIVDANLPERCEIQFSEVELGAPVDPRRFLYARPLDTDWDDITAEAASASNAPE